MQHIAVSNGMIGALAQGKGPPLLFVHGFPLNHTMWRHQVAAFSGKFRVIAPDLRGFGESGVTSGIVSMEKFADDLHGLLHGVYVDKPIVFCGLSMGGYVAWQFLRKYRQQLKALILCDTRAAADTADAAAGRRKLAEKVLSAGPEAAWEAMQPKLFSPTTAEGRPDVVAEVRSMVLQNHREGIAAALHGLAERPDCTEMLSTIDVPTLVICGQDDLITPSAEMRQMAEAIPRAEFVQVPSAGHMSPLENPEVVNDAIGRFLATLR